VRLFDLHCDTLGECLDHGGTLAQSPHAVSLAMRPESFAPWAQVFAVWIPEHLRGDAAWQYFVRAHVRFTRDAQDNAEVIAHVTAADQLAAAHETGRCAAILAVENASVLGGDLRRVEALARAGVRILTLTWNGENEAGFGALANARAGLKPFGRALLRELAQCGIAADVSHLNEPGFWQALDSDAQILASHSGACAVFEHPRNLHDAQIRALVQKDAPIGLTFAYPCRRFGRNARRDLRALTRHAAHMLALGAHDTLCLGTDFDGTPPPRGMSTFADLAQLHTALTAQGMDADAIFYRNALRWFARF
jgi:membrane dipeptidase